MNNSAPKSDISGVGDERALARSRISGANSACLCVTAPELSSRKGISLFALKQRFIADVFQEELNRSEHRWRKKFAKFKLAA